MVCCLAAVNCGVSNPNIGIQFGGLLSTMRSISFLKRGYYLRYWEHRRFKVLDDLTDSPRKTVEFGSKN
jgi:hypothetical protein